MFFPDSPRDTFTTTEGYSIFKNDCNHAKFKIRHGCNFSEIYAAKDFAGLRAAIKFPLI